MRGSGGGGGPGSPRQLPRDSAPRRLTDRPTAGRPPHPPPRPCRPTTSSPSLSSDSCFPQCSRSRRKKEEEVEEEEKRKFKVAEPKAAGKARVAGKTSTLVCACVLRPAYDKLRRILKLYYGLGCWEAGYPPLGPPSLGSPSPRHLLEEKGPLRSRCLPAALLTIHQPREAEPQLSRLNPLACLSETAPSGTPQRRRPDRETRGRPQFCGRGRVPNPRAGGQGGCGHPADPELKRLRWRH